MSRMRGLLVVALVFAYGDRSARAQEAPRTQVSDLRYVFRGRPDLRDLEGGRRRGRHLQDLSQDPLIQGADPLAGAACVGEVGASSSLNVMASIDRLALSQTKPGESVRSRNGFQLLSPADSS